MVEVIDEVGLGRHGRSRVAAERSGKRWHAVDREAAGESVRQPCFGRSQKLKLVRAKVVIHGYPTGTVAVILLVVIDRDQIAERYPFRGGVERRSLSVRIRRT
jgi:hypothetical protein